MYRKTYFNIILGVVIAILILFSASTLYNNYYSIAPSYFQSGGPGGTAKTNLPGTLESNPCRGSESSILLIYVTVSSNYSNLVIHPSTLTIVYNDGSRLQFSSSVFLNDTFIFTNRSSKLVAALIVQPGVITEIYLDNVEIFSLSKDNVTSLLKTSSPNWTVNIYVNPGQTVKVHLNISV